MNGVTRLRRTAQAQLRENLRQVAADRGWTLTRCAQESGLSYSKLTQGMSSNRWFLADEITGLATALEVSVDELMGDSVLKDDVRGSKFDQPVPVERTMGTTGNGRALCCRCGYMRRFRTDEIDYGRQHWDGSPAETGGRRMILPLHCLECGEETTHAELRDLSPHRDSAETYEHGPTRHQQARREFTALVARVRSFGVDIHFRRRGKKLRSEGFLACYEYDESMSRWRIELDMNAPPTVRVSTLTEIWKRIATNEHHCPWDAADGVVLGASEDLWTEAADALVADIARALPVEREKFRLAVADELAQEASDA